MLLAPRAVFSADGGRHALVMGVWDYADSPFPALTGVELDIAKMAAKLRQLGFQTTVVGNPDLHQAKRAVDELGAVLGAEGGTGLFYFSGHGCEHFGENYLIPKGTSITESAHLAHEALPLKHILNSMEEAGTKTNLVFLDCSRSGSGGLSKGFHPLAPIRAPRTFIGFATADEASSMGGKYTEELLKHMDSPGLSIEDVHFLIRNNLISNSLKRQVGQKALVNHETSLDTPFFMVPDSSISSPPSPPVSSPPNVPVSSPPNVPISEMERHLKDLKDLKDELERQQMAQYEKQILNEKQILKPHGEEVEGELDRQIQKLKSGTVAFNTPESMTMEEVNLIHLILSPRADDSSIQEQVTGGGPVVVMNARYSSVVEARLTGEAFQIEATTETRQPTSSLEPTEWRWQLMPKLPGSHQLYLSIYAVVIIEGETHERLLKTFERKLNVTVSFAKSPVAFLKHHPEWVMAGIGLVALGITAVLIYTRFGRRIKASGGSWRTVTQPLKVDLFLSYSSKDRPWVIAFVKALRSRSVIVWMDQGGIVPAAFWAEQISRALSGAKVVVLVGSRNSFASYNVAKEISLASAQQKTILPIILDGSEVPGMLAYQLAGIQLTHIDPGDLATAVNVVMSLPALGVSSIPEVAGS